MRAKNMSLLVIVLVILGLAACTLTPANQENQDTLIATEVERTLQAQAAEEQPAQEDDQEEADFPAKEVCLELGNPLGQRLALNYVIGPKTFSELPNGISGEGCQLVVTGSGEEIPDWAVKNSDFVTEMFDSGWVMDPNFSAATGGGELLTVRKNDHVCMYFADTRPNDPTLCSSDEPISACLERLDLSSIIYEATISCTTDHYVADDVTPDPATDQEEIRISFNEGSTSSYVNGKLESSTSQKYVLRAMEGQEMVVSLINSPPHQGLLVIYGEDGTVLISDHAETTYWSGILPSTQDYYISVHASPNYALSYSMQVIIPPVGEMYTGTFQPLDMTACQNLANIVSSVTGVEARIRPALFYDHIAQAAGDGCEISAWGTFDMFPDRTAISESLMNALGADGWDEAPAYASGGAGGFGTGFIKEDSLCLYFELMHEVDPWACDGYDGPIGECWADLDNTEMYYEIQMTCADPIY
jgi:hypothetical protein